MRRCNHLVGQCGDRVAGAGIRRTGTERGEFPFWAPDSRFLAFQAGGKLRKIDVTGGPPQTLCDVAGTGYIAGDWNREGVIVFGHGVSGPLMRVSSEGGAATPITASSRAESTIRSDSRTV